MSHFASSHSLTTCTHHPHLLPTPARSTPTSHTCRQLLGALQPHDGVELLVPPVTDALTALGAGRQLLGSCLSIFLREPLAEWQREARMLQAQRLPIQGQGGGSAGPQGGSAGASGKASRRASGGGGSGGTGSGAKGAGSAGAGGRSGSVAGSEVEEVEQAHISLKVSAWSTCT